MFQKQHSNNHRQDCHWTQWARKNLALHCAQGQRTTMQSRQFFQEPHTVPRANTYLNWASFSFQRFAKRLAKLHIYRSTKFISLVKIFLLNRATSLPPCQMDCPHFNFENNCIMKRPSPFSHDSSYPLSSQQFHVSIRGQLPGEAELQMPLLQRQDML